MIRILNLISLLIIPAFLSGCFNASPINDDRESNSRGNLSSGVEINISQEVISQFDREKTEILKRYLAGSPLWEIRKERGNFYAVRRELVNGRYETTLNGFYSESRDDGFYQTRVILSFGSIYGFGRDYGNVTKVLLEDDDTVKPVIEEPYSGTPGRRRPPTIRGHAPAAGDRRWGPRVAGHTWPRCGYRRRSHRALSL